MSAASKILAVLCVTVLLGACTKKPSPGVMGAYRFTDGSVISIRKIDDDALRYREFESGDSRRLYSDSGARYVAGPSFRERSPVELIVDFDIDETGTATALSWRLKDRPPDTATRVNRSETVAFTSDGARLVGRLDLPDGSGPHPAVVLVHGSGSLAATDYYCNGDFLAANGIAALTFDKRGTGRSAGETTFDFNQLARDVVAAVELLKTRNDIDSERIGLSGYSQGGWVAPLAATLTEDVRFVLVSYGLIESSAVEARLETRNLMRKRGVDEESLKQIEELTLAAVRIVDSGFRDGWEEFAALKKKHKQAPWRKQLKGTTVGSFLKYPRWLVKMLGPRRAPKDLDWYYDSVDVLNRLSIPMVWFLGDADESAPNEETIPRLRRLQAEGKPYELVLFAGADHTMLLFDEVDGQRVYTGYVPDYFRTEVLSARRLVGLD